MKGTIDFIGVGARKAGTTWIYKQLKKHPQIFIPSSKELSYFSSKIYREEFPIDWYFDQFKKKNFNQICGEISVTYFELNTHQIEKIKEINSNIKIILNIRDPIERLFSEYNFNEIYDLNKKKNISNFDDFVMNFRKNNEYYYSNTIKNYQKIFDMKNIHVINFNNIIQKPLEVINKLNYFLGVEEILYNKDIHKEVGTTYRVKYKILENIRRNFYKILRQKSENSFIFDFLFSKLKGSNLSNFYKKLNSINKPVLTKQSYKNYIKYFENDILMAKKLLNLKNENFFSLKFKD